MNWDWDKLKEQQSKQGPALKTPQVDELIEKFKNLKLPGGPVIIVVILILLFIGTSTFYTVKFDEVGVVQRFGKWVRTTQPGLNFKLPMGIEKVTKVPIRTITKEEFGFRTSDTKLRGGFNTETEVEPESLMLTGDLNVAVVPWIVQYRIKDPYNYLFKVRNIQKILRDMSEAAMRLVVGDRSINEIISKRNEISLEAAEVLQKELDNAETGIYIVSIEMKKTNVPGPVQASFNEVNQATQEKEQMIYQAREDYNKAIPAAKGEADRTIKAAEGYSLDRVNRAKGDASRFSAVYTEYAKAQDVTKRRMYLEMIKEVFPKLGPKYILDEDQKNVLPLLNLGQQQIGVEK
ncbi:MAG: FtsH protease activity modulator HflK [Proteobacteria bacterium]|nr:FtsH protease activity modulator HflK [Pseudomonadota bacterium]MBU4470241.1 FtsH protease activity modulator HflK [Pseudomonadota bacterium]MCG2752656.1 FtsH protease activity modulator HflK [Desulfobacteraceae bacterium]